MKSLFTTLFLGIGLLLTQAQEIGSIEKGSLSIYKDEAQNTATSSGEIYSKTKLSAAHKSLPMQTLVEVLNLENNKSIFVKINDRLDADDTNLLKISKAAAQQLGISSNSESNTQLRLIQLPSNFGRKARVSRSSTSNRSIKVKDEKLQSRIKSIKKLKKSTLSSEDYQFQKEERELRLLSKKVQTYTFSDSTNFVIQLGAFYEKSNLNKARFKAIGLDLIVEDQLFIQKGEGNEPAYRLQYGYFKKSEVRVALRQLKADFPDAFIVSKTKVVE